MAIVRSMSAKRGGVIEMVFRYYSVNRPVAPGNFPSLGVVKVRNFGKRMFCAQINRKAYGYVDYDRPLQQCDLEEYHLVG